MKYRLIRDKVIFELDDSEIEICDSKNEINDFSFQEIISLLKELKEVDYKDLSIYVEIYGILDNLIRTNEINFDDLEKKYNNKEKIHGLYTKYLLKIP